MVDTQLNGFVSGSDISHGTRTSHLSCIDFFVVVVVLQLESIYVLLLIVLTGLGFLK